MKKIIVTLGPSSLNEDFLKNTSKYKNSSYEVSLLRINMSHTNIDDLKQTIDFVRSFTDIPICIDSEGAQVRCQKIDQGKCFLEKNDTVKIHHKEIVGDSHNISLYPNDVIRQLHVGDVLYIDFDSVAIMVTEEKDDHLLSQVVSEGTVSSNRGIDINRDIDLPSLTEKDLRAFEIGKENSVEHYAFSFAKNPNDISKLRRNFGKDIYIISKIESIKGLSNLDGIIFSSDEILIDRGDLSRQVPMEMIPFLQHLIIQRGKFLNKPVLVATNLLETMVKQNLPTRAEMNDVVSTLKSGADGLVLAAETAIGMHPLKSIQIISTLIDYFYKWEIGGTISDILNFLKERN